MRMHWSLPKNSGDCLYEFQDPKWVVVHGCDIGMDPTCKCEELPTGPPALKLTKLIEIVRKPCVEPKPLTDDRGIDAYGFLVPLGTGKLHCIRTKTSTDWVHYFYDPAQTEEPRPSSSDGFEGYMECTDPEGRILAFGILADFNEYAQLKQLMQVINFQLTFVTDLLKSQGEGFDVF